MVGVARHFAPSQKVSALDLELPVLSLDAASLARLFGEHEIDLVVNCLGVLQDGPGSDTSAVHRDFVERLLEAIHDSGRAIRLVHISIPGTADEDRTAFSRTKREAERLIAASGLPHAILRPGFVVAPSAYGGSAMLRALAAFPIAIADERSRPRRFSRSPSRISQRPSPGSPAATSSIATCKRRDLGPDAAATGHAGQCDRTFPLVVRHRTYGRASRCRLSCSISARARRSRQPARLDAADTLDCDRRIAPRRHGRSAPWMAATGIVPKTIAEVVGRAPPPFRTNGSRGCFW